MNKEIRLIAEWESCSSVLLALPERHTDWDYILEEARDQYRRMIRSFTDNGLHCVVLVADRVSAGELLQECDSSKITLIEAEYNDTWTRDYGPISVVRGDRLRALDFGFNGWGLKFASAKDNLVNLFLRDRSVIMPETYRNERDFILEGGSIETDGCGTLLTTSTCLCSPNRNGGHSKGELNAVSYTHLTLPTIRLV